LGTGPLSVRAQVLVVPSLQDHMVNPLPAINFAKLIFAPTLELTSNCGHLAIRCEEKKLNDAVARFLEK
jgi:homoserine O-acetyltransferase